MSLPKNIANAVQKTNDESITGVKTFSSDFVDTTLEGGIAIKSTTIRKNITPSADKFTGLNILDTTFDGTNLSNANRLGSIEVASRSSGVRQLQMFVCNPNGEEDNSGLSAGFTSDGVKYSLAPETHFGRTGYQDIVTRSFFTRMDLYINPTTGNDNNDGLTAATAFKTLDKALSSTRHMACKPYLHLAAGTYSGGVSINDGRCVVLVLHGSVEINGDMVIGSSSFLFIDDFNNIYPTITVNGRVSIENSSFVYSWLKLIINNTSTVTALSLTYNSVFVSREALEIYGNTGNSQIGINLAVHSVAYICKSLKILPGSVANSTILYAFKADTCCSVFIFEADVDINCASIPFNLNKGSQLTISSRTYAANTFTCNVTTDSEALFGALQDCSVDVQRVNINFTSKTTNTTSANTALSFNIGSTLRYEGAVSTFKYNNANTGKYFIGAQNGSHIFIGSGTMKFIGQLRSDGATMIAHTTSNIYIGPTVSFSGSNVTGGKRYAVTSVAMIAINGHSDGANRIPGATAGSATAASYGYYG